MIIDLILERRDNEKHGIPYSGRDFYERVSENIGGRQGYRIASALDGGTEHDIRCALIEYIASSGYSLDIVDYVLKRNWINGTEEEPDSIDNAVKLQEYCQRVNGGAVT